MDMFTYIINILWREGALNRPVAEAVVQSRIFQSQPSCPLHGAHGFPVKRDLTIPAHLPHLLRLRGPSAISRLIVPVVVDTINRVLRCWLMAHVQKEISKCSPSRTYSNAATPIVFVFGVVGIGATLNHVTPTTILKLIVFALEFFDVEIFGGKFWCRHGVNLSDRFVSSLGSFRRRDLLFEPLLF